MKMVQVSAVIITYNEEKNIARCLASLKDVVDEIIVVDSFSTDKTTAICKSFNAKVFQNAFKGHIEQKNYALSLASNQVVLSLDADEALDETLKKSIQQSKTNFNFDAYSLNRLTNYCGHWVKYCGWYPDKKIRLFNSTKGKWVGTNPHDKFELDKPNTPIGKLAGNLLHYSYYTVAEHREQTLKFSTIAAKALFQDGKKTNLALVYLKTIFKFISSYFIKLGFLDGKYGYTICRISAHYNYLKYSKLLRLWKEKQ